MPQVEPIALLATTRLDTPPSCPFRVAAGTLLSGVAMVAAGFALLRLSTLPTNALLAPFLVPRNHHSGWAIDAAAGALVFSSIAVLGSAAALAAAGLCCARGTSTRAPVTFACALPVTVAAVYGLMIWLPSLVCRCGDLF
jgi:hypothetical protein